MTAFKRVFANYSPSKCRFLKFHLNLHLVETIRLFGSLRVIDTSGGERANKGVKVVYRRTNRKRRDMLRQMAAALARQTIIKEVERERVDPASLLSRNVVQPADTFRGLAFK